MDPWKDNPAQPHYKSGVSALIIFKKLFWALFSFNGRLGLGGIWVFVFSLIISGHVLNIYAVTTGYLAESYIIPFPYNLVLLWVASAILVKRFHDIGKSGWWALLLFVPFINIWAFIMCFFFRGSNGINAYGEARFKNNA